MERVDEVGEGVVGASASTLQKFQELSLAVVKLKEEATRLQNNLDKMHQVQIDLYRTDVTLLKYLEEGRKLKESQVSLERLIECIQNRELKNST